MEKWLKTLLFLSLTRVAFGVEPWLLAIPDVEVDHLKQALPFEWTGDPFLKEPGRSGLADDETKYVLEMILFDKTRPIALINKMAVEKGDRVGDRVVKEIGRDFVVLEGQQSLLELVLASNKPELTSTIPVAEKR